MPQHHSLHWIESELEQLAHRDQLRRLRVRESPHVSGIVQVDGKTLVDFSSNDYLSLAADSRLVNALHACAGQVGVGSGASPLVSGYGVWHRKLEAEIARFEGSEAAIVFGSGYAANMAAITALVSEGDAIWSDQFNHASIIDGCRLSGAKIEIFRHNDLDHLRSLAENRSHFRRVLIVTDSLFSMDGDFAHLPELAEIAEQAHAMLMIDEAHATGVFDEHGRGVAEKMKVENRIPVRIGTFSKALGGVGGFLVGSKALVEWIRNKARTYIYSTAFPEAAAAVGITALAIVRSEPNRRRELLSKSQFVRDELKRAGISVGASESQIIPIIIGSAARTVQISEQLAEAGFFVPAIRPPSVPEDSSRLRLSLTCAHSQTQLESLVAAVKKVLGKNK